MLLKDVIHFHYSIDFLFPAASIRSHAEDTEDTEDAKGIVSFYIFFGKMGASMRRNWGLAGSHGTVFFPFLFLFRYRIHETTKCLNTNCTVLSKDRRSTLMTLIKSVIATKKKKNRNEIGGCLPVEGEEHYVVEKIVKPETRDGIPGFRVK